MNVVITGATKGIGRAIAERFAAAGNTIFACARSEADLLLMKERIKQDCTNSTVHIKAADLADKQQVLDFAQWVTAQATPDVLVNNAGLFTPGPFIQEEDGALENMIAVNLYSAYHLTRALLPAMMERKSGHIFNMCSVASFRAFDNGGSYGISKFALLGFSKNLREQMKPHHIKVTSVFPGATWSASWEGSGVEAERMMEANDIAEMVFAATQLSSQAVVEDILMRPQGGDI